MLKNIGPAVEQCAWRQAGQKNEAMAFFDTVSHGQQVNTVFSPGGPLFAGFEGKHYLCSPSFSLL
jgi:hypothetical protein